MVDALMEFTLEIVRPIEEHAKIIMNWRNDPETLDASYDDQPKQWPLFYSEFLQKYFTLPNLPPLFVLREGKRVAFIRFRSEPTPFLRKCEISLNVDPQLRGKGIGYQSLLLAKEWVFNQGYDAIYAEIKQNNVTSQKLFEKAGYQKNGAIEKLHLKSGKRVPIFCYLLPLSSNLASSVFVIAEAGSNWRMGNPKRDWQMARTLIELAKEAGADAIKFQTYRAETTYVSSAGKSSYLSHAGIDEEISALFSDLEMPYEMIGKLAEYCEQQEIFFMSTPFSPQDFKAIDPFVSFHKIASYEIGHPHLLRLAAESGKPLFLSTGASTEEEIAWAIDYYQRAGGGQLILLQCTASYPAPSIDLHLRSIPWLKKRFHLPVGLSDHSLDPYLAPYAAVALGAEVIEKHFTLHRRLPGPDHSFAVDPDQLKQMVKGIREIEKMRGFEVKQVSRSEKELRSFAKRGVQAIREVKLGDRFEEGVNIAILRPGTCSQGVHPRYLVEIEGSRAKRSLVPGEGVQFSDW